MTYQEETRHADLVLKRDYKQNFTRTFVVMGLCCCICKIINFLFSAGLLALGLVIISKDRLSEAPHDWNNPSYLLFTAGRILVGYSSIMLFFTLLSVLSSGKNMLCGHEKE